MARDQISKIAYKTLQQGKSIAGLAHKELSTRIMNFMLPDNKLGTFNIDKKLLQEIQNSMDLLREEDTRGYSDTLLQMLRCMMQIYRR